MAEIKETNIDTVYHTINDIGHTIISSKYPTRREMIDYLIMQYPQYYMNEDYPTKTAILNSDIKCPCTDCGGNDSIIDCKMEERYFEYINTPIVFL